MAASYLVDEQEYENLCLCHILCAIPERYDLMPAQAVNGVSSGNPICSPCFHVHPIAPHEFDAVFQVYRQCEDFLALGPQPHASPEMVAADLKHSQEEGGLFCGIYDDSREMLGIVDFVSRGYVGDPSQAFLSLLMIAAPHRGHGLGSAVVQWVEREIRRDPGVRVILSGVQVNNPGAIRFWQRMGYHIVAGPELMPDQTTVFHLLKDLLP
jgi:ribosomal protein S18 acetylase RimI-like enzyme